jgi:hypothetical protein
MFLGASVMFKCPAFWLFLPRSLSNPAYSPLPLSSSPRLRPGHGRRPGRSTLVVLYVLQLLLPPAVEAGTGRPPPIPAGSTHTSLDPAMHTTYVLHVYIHASKSLWRPCTTMCYRPN